MPDPLKPARQDVQQEAANELLGLQAHHLLARLMAVIFPAKADLAINEIDQAIDWRWPPDAYSGQDTRGHAEGRQTVAWRKPPTRPVVLAPDSRAKAAAT